MLTTIGTDGKSLHSRAMRDAKHEKLVFSYVYGEWEDCGGRGDLRVI
jgi:hypothetical protein